jgi:hypothetical protein
VHESQGEFVATLVESDEYIRHLNQVCGLTTRGILFVKRKFVSRHGGEIVIYPVTSCTGIFYKDSRSPILMFFGVALACLIAFIFYMMIANWDSLEPGTRIPVGALGLAMIYGMRWIFGARRHELIFTLQDSTCLRWKSRPGDYKYKKGSVDKVVDFARSKGLLAQQSIK